MTHSPVIPDFPYTPKTDLMFDIYIAVSPLDPTKVRITYFVQGNQAENNWADWDRDKIPGIIDYLWTAYRC